jgi:hypothetical protein
MLQMPLNEIAEQEAAERIIMSVSLLMFNL